MKILRRTRSFSAIPAPGEMASQQGQAPSGPAGNQQPQQSMSSNEIAIEQMKLQRQQARLQQAKQIAQQQENMARMRQLVQLQKMEQQKDEAEDKNQLRAIKQERQSTNAAVQNAGLYKVKSKPSGTVSMPR